MANMGLSNLVAGDKVIYKRKFRWIFRIDEITGENGSSWAYAIPSIKAARPQYTFKEHGAQHLNEEIFFPMKAEWKPITLTLYDIVRNKHPIIEWIAQVYRANPSEDYNWYPSVSGESSAIQNPFKKLCYLELYDGCGNIVEKWKYENAWPQSVDFGDLDYSSSDVLLCTITLRYDRACWVQGCQ